MEQEKVRVTVKVVCPVCGNEEEIQIEPKEGLSEDEIKEVIDSEGKCIGYKKVPCVSCSRYINGMFLIVETQEAEQEEDGHQNIYRTGRVIGIDKTNPLIQSLPEEVQKRGWGFLDKKECEECININNLTIKQESVEDEKDSQTTV